MIRHLTTLVLCGVLGSMVLVSNAEACHKKRCGCAPVVCAPKPVPCVTYAVCAPKVKHCFKLPSFYHKKPVCTTTVAYCAPTPVYQSYAAPAAYYPTATPQASAQH
jgi:hypothetical protein